MALKFLNKKGWHTGSLRNIENVWKAEQKHDAEQKKLEELRKQIGEERERAEFRLLQEQAGLVPKQERLDFLYDSGLAVGKGSSDGFKALEAVPPKNDEDTGPSNAPGALFDERPQSSNDAWRKLHSDPLLLIRQREQEAIARIKNNPIQMASIRKSVKGKEKKHKEKKEKRKKHSHSSKRDASSEEDSASERGERKRRSRHLQDDSASEGEERRRRSHRSEEVDALRGSRRSEEYDANNRLEKNRESRCSEVYDASKGVERSRGSHRSERYDASKGVERSRGSHRSEGYDASKGVEISRGSHRSEAYDVSKGVERKRRSYHHSSRNNEPYSHNRRTDSETEENKKRSYENSRDERHSTQIMEAPMGNNERSHQRPQRTVTKLSEEEKAARLREMEMDAELHEQQRWKRLKTASENDAREASQANSRSGSNFLDAAQKSVFGAEKGGSSTIEESVRRRKYYSQGQSEAYEGNAFRR
ncbi:hypothetical protein IFM89_017699 [Coptis chinensis]|uniref:CBF1-interacting co-repressor CIR N-terminal domain-containing protein n=1 Tax=Coptis chinensis TaxID=261450 RepID=A0A835I305_9MAGN|nr:hypothetical protein IFM89_017699 [Coptis chinensis]